MESFYRKPALVPFTYNRIACTKSLDHWREGTTNAQGNGNQIKNDLPQKKGATAPFFIFKYFISYFPTNCARITFNAPPSLNHSICCSL